MSETQYPETLLPKNNYKFAHFVQQTRAQRKKLAKQIVADGGVINFTRGQQAVMKCDLDEKVHYLKHNYGADSFEQRTG